MASMQVREFDPLGNGSGAPAKGKRDGHLVGFDSVEQILDEFLPPDALAEVKRCLYGANRGAPVERIPLPLATLEAAEEHDFDCQG